VFVGVVQKNKKEVKRWEAVADLGRVRGVQLNPPFGRQLYIYTDTCRPAIL